MNLQAGFRPARSKATFSFQMCESLTGLPFDLLVEVAARVVRPRDLSAFLQACKVTSSLKFSPQLLSRWLLYHRPSTSALITAAAAGNPAAVRCIIDHAIRSDVSLDGLDLRGQSGARALCVAAAHGHVGVLQLLLAAGAPANGAQHTDTDVSSREGQAHQEEIQPAFEAPQLPTPATPPAFEVPPEFGAPHLPTPAPPGTAAAGGTSSTLATAAPAAQVAHTVPLAAAASMGHLECVKVLLEGVPLVSCLRNTHPNPSDCPLAAEPGLSNHSPYPAPVAHDDTQQALLTPATPSAAAAAGGAAAGAVEHCVALSDAPPHPRHPIFSLAVDTRPIHAETEQDEAKWLPLQQDVVAEQQQQQQQKIMRVHTVLAPQGQRFHQRQQQLQRKQAAAATTVSLGPHRPPCLQGEDARSELPAEHPMHNSMLAGGATPSQGGSTSTQVGETTSMDGKGPTPMQPLNQASVGDACQAAQPAESTSIHGKGSTSAQPLNQAQMGNAGQAALLAGSTSTVHREGSASVQPLNQARVEEAGQAALLAAACCGQVHCIRLLLSWGADAKVQEGEALCLAAAGGHTSSMAALLEAGCAVDAQEGRPLILAASNGHMEAVKALWEAGAKSGPNRAFSMASALVGAAGAGHEVIVQTLLGWGAGVESQEGDALQAAAASGHLPICHLLLAAGAGAWAHDSAALRCAVGGAHASVVELLLQAGADAGAANQAPIREAARIGHVVIFRLLLQYGANAHCMDESPLRTAASAGALDVVEELLGTAHADVHANEDEALLWAIDNGHVEVVQLLLRYGATTHEHALWCAIARGHQQIVTILMDQGTSLVGAEGGVAKDAGSEQQTP
ncbi:ankyrin repeat-containing domain protein [Dunaliella salina]|uniref:Ankyrin repeat-containing domain protein n=1 Tax=Dunaliella salina TaxID=3046 RepID=A0ABQ7H4C1_DUNSA|nr:ankyrin repeat-containing domain protein [Dunaliella salina]|eukprot:KAF5841707.1 ankyrin repeat-containing domain protein [Dunaliella salina]